MIEQGPAPARLRIYFAKRGVLRYTSHLDLARIWERMLRRANVLVIYSQGFNPRPKLQLAAALPLGYTSTCEIVDLWLADEVPSSFDELQARLQAVAPEGLEIVSIERVELKGPALQTLTRQATYRIDFRDAMSADALREAAESVLSAAELPRQRRDKTYDLRPLILQLEVLEDHMPPALMATLSLGNRGTGRPDELLGAMGLEAGQAMVERVAIEFKDADG